jgi:hypothetical protein
LPISKRFREQQYGVVGYGPLLLHEPGHIVQFREYSGAFAAC